MVVNGFNDKSKYSRFVNPWNAVSFNSTILLSLKLIERILSKIEIKVIYRIETLF
jgi:hypothetical protein